MAVFTKNGDYQHWLRFRPPPMSSTVRCDLLALSGMCHSLTTQDPSEIVFLAAREYVCDHKQCWRVDL
jgi:hypothetical protein